MTDIAPNGTFTGPTTSIATIQGVEADGRIRVQLDDESVRSATVAWLPNAPDWNQCTGLRALVTRTTSDDLVLFALVDTPPIAEPASEGPEVLRLRAGKEIRIECGDARIQLHADGRIELRGAQLVHRAKGLVKLKGGAISIN